MIVLSALILITVLVVFSFGRSPVFRVDRTGIALVGATLTISSGLLSFQEAVEQIDMATIVLLFAMMLISASLSLAGFFEWLGRKVCLLVSTGQQLLAVIVICSGVLSGLFINDIVCLLFTPVVLELCRRSNSPPLPHLIALATSANLGSAATLIGNPQNILIGSLSGLSFTEYFRQVSGLVVLGLIINYWLIARIYSASMPKKLQWSSTFVGVNHPYLMGKTLMILFGLVIAFILGLDRAPAALLGAALILMTRRVNPNKLYHRVDFNLLVMFMGLFVIMAGVEKSGLLQELIRLSGFEAAADLGSFALFTLVLSNLFSNVPAVMLLQQVIPSPADPDWWTSLAFFSTVAGNLTLPGSVANLIVAELAKKEGVQITFWEYFKTGFPLTCLVTLMAYGFLIGLP